MDFRAAIQASVIAAQPLLILQLSKTSDLTRNCTAGKGWAAMFVYFCVFVDFFFLGCCSLTRFGLFCARIVRICSLKA